VTLLVDENLSPRQAAIRRGQDHDAITVTDAVLGGKPKCIENYGMRLLVDDIAAVIIRDTGFS
jgi:hypothetical protein